LYYNDLWKLSPSTNEWTWVGGSNTANASGVYGTQGVASPGNIPAAKAGAVSWTDKSGNFWIFGGQNAATNYVDSYDYYNDLWEYSPSTNQWTWVGGSNVYNVLGVYGTQGVASAANVPGARVNAASWTDANGNFWLFGGVGVSLVSGIPSTPFLNDLWEFNPSTKQWTWVNGSNTFGLAVYGTQGVASANNYPGARENAASWIDKSGNLWLFGGDGIGTSSQWGGLNDLWKYTPSTNQWTWMGGSDTYDAVGVYGTRGVASATNVPGARVYPTSWTDADGNFWLFGGDGFGTSELVGIVFLGDLWEYNPSTQMWTWVSGTGDGYQTGIYGTQGVASANNNPPPRGQATGWTDSSGNLWLFGGNGVNGSVASPYNEWWKFEP
jgi:N-acetylneuraminic acid mutarotase